jgi:hypothetical protein
MFCTQCGANNADNAMVCTQCGRSLQAAAPPLPVQRVAMAQAPVDVPNYLVFAILVTVLCCLPAGIPAIVYAAQVNSKLQAGDISGAQLASKNAKMWCWISAGAALAIVVLWGILGAIGALSNMHR